MNVRIKHRPDGTIYETLYCSHHVFESEYYAFEPMGIIQADTRQHSKPVKANEPSYTPREIQAEIEELTKQEQNRERSQRRAKRSVRDIYHCNPELDTFLTATIGEEWRTDTAFALRKFRKFLDNLVHNYGIKYVFIPEYHKDGAIHFHGLISSHGAKGDLKLVDSGTVTCEGHKKPIKATTADKLKIPSEARRTVYNFPTWKYGFTTAIKLYGDRERALSYVVKYITKTDSKIGGRYYYSGGDIQYPFTTFMSFSGDVDSVAEKLKSEKKDIFITDCGIFRFLYQYD